MKELKEIALKELKEKLEESKNLRLYNKIAEEEVKVLEFDLAKLNEKLNILKPNNSLIRSLKNEVKKSIKRIPSIVRSKTKEENDWRDNIISEYSATRDEQIKDVTKEIQQIGKKLFVLYKNIDDNIASDAILNSSIKNCSNYLKSSFTIDKAYKKNTTK